MQLIVNIKDENLAKKIIKVLNIFKDEGIGNHQKNAKIVE